MIQEIVGQISCSIQSQCSPLLSEVCDQTYSWLEQFELIPASRDQQKLIRNSCGPEFVCYAYPEGELAGLVWTARYTCWTILLDEAVKSLLAKKRLEDVITLYSQCAQQLEIDHAVPDPQSLLFPALVLSLSDLWSAVSQSAPLHWCQCFSQDMKALLMHSIPEASECVDRVIPDLETYYYQRLHTGGTNVCVDLIEYSINSFLPPFIIQSEYIQNIREITCNIANWINDLYSWNKENHDHDPHNLITVLQNQDKCSLQEAVDKACQMLTEALNAFLETAEHLPGHFSEHTEDLRWYLKHLSLWIAGNFSWYPHTNRYKVAPATETHSSSCSFVRIIQVANPSS
jgi:hypothetical protein